MKCLQREYKWQDSSFSRAPWHKPAGFSHLTCKAELKKSQHDQALRFLPFTLTLNQPRLSKFVSLTM